MDTVLTAVRALQASDAQADSVGVEPDTHPLLDAVQAANAKFETAFDLSSVLTVADKKLLLQFGTHSLRDGRWTPTGASAWLRLLKILARTRTDLDPLFAPEFILYLVRNIESHVQASTIVSNPPPVATILSDCVRLLLNLCIINRKAIHAVFTATIAPEPHDADEEDEQKYAEPPPASPLCSLVALLPDVRNTAADPEVRFFFVRILMFVLVEPKLARDAIKHAALYQNLIKTVLQCAEEARLTGEVEMKDSSAAAAAASSSSASAAAPSSGSDANAAAEHRKVVMETLKVLANLSVMQDDALPSLASVVQPADPALYTRYLQRLAAILATGVEIPAECKEGYKGVPEITAAVEAAQKQAAIDRAARDAEAAAAAAAEAAAAVNAPPAQDPAAAPAAAPATDAPRPATPTSVAGASVSTSTSVAPAAAAPDATAGAGSAPATAAGAGAAPSAAAPAPAAAASTPHAQFPPLQREQTRIILALMEREAAEAAAAPNANAASLLQIQQDISNTFNSPEIASAMLPYLESDGCKSFHSLIQILHRALVWIARDPVVRRKDGEANLSPILTVLSKLVKLSPVLRTHAKRCIFLDLAEAPVSNPDGTPFRKSDATNYAMSPAGALSDKLIDPDPLCLKTLLLSWIITLNFNLKQIVSEWIWRVCGEDTSEYIRLLGFGNAVGLLAEKGLPGFGMLRSTAINMDMVIKSGKKL